MSGENPLLRGGEKQGPADQVAILPAIASDTTDGLSSNPKYLLSKYFYDDRGSAIFQEIMNMPEYYLTGCEMEIFETKSGSISDFMIDGSSNFNLIEFGSGDGIKTRILLKSLLDRNAYFRFFPVDISPKANDELCRSLNNEFPSLEVIPRNGDYSELIRTGRNPDEIKKVILFLGSNIGNLNDQELRLFISDISEFCNKGDMVLIGFDLKKSPSVIMKAYNDPAGYTRKFNLNHLARLNSELYADFNLRNFEHHTEYNPLSGKVKSFLISTVEQNVTVRITGQTFTFARWEPVFMELSRKFELREIESMAVSNGFRVEAVFSDHRQYFADSLWIKT